ncbi:MAG TPA: AMP-binding protein, partial [Longimicrobiaceae bacterium]|nr:AMP-binding protein [Longimicrobiaceae bacterium]
MDGRSRRLLVAELFEDYEALLRGSGVERPAPPPYREHVEWLQGLDGAAAREFWTGLLAGFEPPDELAARPAGETPPEEGGARHDFALPAGATRGLEALARDEGVTLNTLVQCAWGVLLSRYTGRDDVVFGNARACRSSGVQGVERMVGLFSNTVPLRVRVREEETVRGLLRAVREQWVAMRPHEHTPLAAIRGWSELPGGARLFESIVGFERSGPDEAFRALGPAWLRRSFELHQWTSYPLALVVHGGTRLSAQLLYDPGRFDASFVRRMADHFARVLEGFAAAPGAPLHALELLAPGERARLLGEPGRASAELPADAPVHRRFEEQAARTPGAPAVLSGDLVLSYAELDARAGRLARRLRRLGVGPERRVGLLLERSPETVVALLAVLKAGGAYVPLDPAYPEERLRLVARDAGVVLVLAQERTAHLLGGDPPAPLLVLDGEAGAPDAAPDAPPAPVGGRSAAYVIYTSGSTGTPKGVVVEHRSVLRLATGMGRACPAPGDVGLMLAPLAFDASTFEVWGALLNGAA